MSTEVLIVFLSSYVLGSIPFGLILTKIFINKDIRKIGSKNIGATNVLRTGNKSIAILTLLLDILKGGAAVSITEVYFPNLIFLSGLAAFLGHIFPVWLKFNGGKGVATFVGILISINIFYALIFGLIWFLTFVISKYSSLSSLLASIK